MQIKGKPIIWIPERRVSREPLIELPLQEYQKVVATPIHVSSSVATLVDLRATIIDSSGVSFKVDLISASELRGGEIDYIEIRRSRPLTHLGPLNPNQYGCSPADYRDYSENPNNRYQIRIKFSGKGIIANDYTFCHHQGNIFTVEDPTDLRDMSYRASEKDRAKKIALGSESLVYVYEIFANPTDRAREEIVNLFALGISAIETADKITSKYARNFCTLFEKIKSD